jgi:hypothetical protein
VLVALHVDVDLDVGSGSRDLVGCHLSDNTTRLVGSGSSNESAEVRDRPRDAQRGGVSIEEVGGHLDAGGGEAPSCSKSGSRNVCNRDLRVERVDLGKEVWEGEASFGQSVGEVNERKVQPRQVGPGRDSD